MEYERELSETRHCGGRDGLVMADCVENLGIVAITCVISIRSHRRGIGWRGNSPKERPPEALRVALAAASRALRCTFQIRRRAFLLPSRSVVNVEDTCQPT